MVYFTKKFYPFFISLKYGSFKILQATENNMMVPYHSHQKNSKNLAKFITSKSKKHSKNSSTSCHWKTENAWIIFGHDDMISQIIRVHVFAQNRVCPLLIFSTYYWKSLLVLNFHNIWWIFHQFFDKNFHQIDSSSLFFNDRKKSLKIPRKKKSMFTRTLKKSSCFFFSPLTNFFDI
jgi:hypothetical protein